MPRLIDADVFKENMDYVCGAGGCLEPVTSSVIEFVKRHIDAQTEVDAVPVVRCKDCKYWRWAKERKGFCEKTNNFDRLWDETDWCSYGENNGKLTQPERKKGKWIDRGYLQIGFHCSECGGYVLSGQENYCPWCGADMRGGIDETD